jgi:hypothetical protein
MRNVTRLPLPDDLRRWHPAALPAVAVLFSFAFAGAFLWMWPCRYIFDDGGIVVKYMDSFAQGAFYSYNVSDGPVFGISGFFHGILSGTLSATHLLSPDDSVIASNFIGAALSSLAILLLLRVFTDSCTLVVLGWATTICASTRFVQTAFQGLETPLHLAVVLLAYWALFGGRARTLWFLGAAAIISKLDAVPVIAILWTLRLVQAFDGTRPLPSLWRELRVALPWAGIPLTAWLLFAWAVFGGPLPQTAYAKMMFGEHPQNQLAFLVLWWEREGLRILLYLIVSTAGAGWCLRRAGRRLAVRVAALVAGSAGVTLLYCAFNPGERMSWYYVLPQTLLVLGAVASLLSLIRVLPERAVWFRFAACAALALSLPFNAISAKRAAVSVIEWVRQVEPERIAVGRFIHSLAAPSDRLYAGHGHIARYSRLYTYDYTGLNSRVITRIRREGKSPLHELQPEWVARHGLLEVEEQAQLAYELVASFYNTSLVGWPAWRVYRRNLQSRERPLTVRQVMPADARVDGERVGSHGIFHLRGRTISLGIPETEALPGGLAFGIAKQAGPFTLTVTGEYRNISQPPRILENIPVPASNAGDLVNGQTLACSVDLPAGQRFSSIRIDIAPATSQPEPQPLLMLEPVWLSSPAQATEPANQLARATAHHHP